MIKKFVIDKNKETLFFIILFCIFLLNILVGLRDWDVIWESFLGEKIVKEGNFFGYTDFIWGNLNVNTYYNHEWLICIFYYLLISIFGLAKGFLIIKLSFILVSVSVIYFFIKYIHKNYEHMTYITLIGNILFTFVYVYYFMNAKPYNISVLLFIFLLWLLEKRVDYNISFKRFSFFILLLVVLWNNIHSGSIVLFFFILGLYWLFYWRDLKTILLGLFSIILLGLNPFGYKLILSDVLHATDTSMRNIIKDWVSLDICSLKGILICCLFILCLFVIYVNKLNKNNFIYVLLLFCFFFMTINTVRHFIYFYPIGLLLVNKDCFTVTKQVSKDKFLKFTLSFLVYTLCIVVGFFIKFNKIQKEYSNQIISDSLQTILNKTNRETSVGLFNYYPDVVVYGLDSFCSPFYPTTAIREKDSYNMLRGSTVFIESKIQYYNLNKFLIPKYRISNTNEKLTTNLYDYLINNDNYVLLYEDDVYSYFVNKHIVY